MDEAFPGKFGFLLNERRGGAPKQRPAFAVYEVGAAEGRSPEAAPSFRCA